MTRDEGIRALGLPTDAGREDVHRAYKLRCRPLKLRFLQSRRPEEKSHHQEALRDLVCMRDAALGVDSPHEWRANRLGVSGRKLLTQLDETALASMRRADARRFLDLGRKARKGQIVGAYELHKRALIRRFVTADSDEEMLRVRKARQKLRTIRNFALANR